MCVADILGERLAYEYLWPFKAAIVALSGGRRLVARRWRDSQCGAGVLWGALALPDLSALDLRDRVLEPHVPGLCGTAEQTGADGRRGNESVAGGATGGVAGRNQGCGGRHGPDRNRLARIVGDYR